jgi:hypothetical protein
MGFRFVQMALQCAHRLFGVQSIVFIQSNKGMFLLSTRCLVFLDDNSPKSVTLSHWKRVLVLDRTVRYQVLELRDGTIYLLLYEVPVAPNVLNAYRRF